MLVVMAYIAAGLSLLLGTREKPSGPRERLLGMGALVACGLLVFSTPGRRRWSVRPIGGRCWHGRHGAVSGARHAVGLINGTCQGRRMPAPARRQRCAVNSRA